MKSVKLPSGAELQITLATFAESRSLYQAVLEEAKVLRLDPGQEIDVNLYKDLFCTALSSKKIETALWDCMKKVLYNGLKIDKDTFESEESRQDYVMVCLEVGKENISPFLKSLYAEWYPVLAKAMKSQG